MYKPYKPSGAVNNHQNKGAVNNHPKASQQYAPYRQSDSSDDSIIPDQTPRRSFKPQHNNSQNRSQNEGKNYNNKRNYNNRKRTEHSEKRERTEPPPPRPVNHIELIPCHFNSLQVRMLSDQLWDTNNIPEITGLLKFFELLRKAIMKFNVKDKIEVLEPRFPEMLQSLEPVIPSGPSLFSEEITPRIDGNTNYDEETWAKMFIMMLPRVYHQITLDLETFLLCAEISQQITQSEVAVIRVKLENDIKGPKQQELNKLGDLQDQYMWSQEKYEAEEKKVNAKYNAMVYQERQLRLKEVYELYDKLIEYFKTHDPSDLSDPVILAGWRMILRNPCFPNPALIIGNHTIPAEHFSIIEAYNLPPLTFSEDFATIRSWYYGTHPNVDAINPTQSEFQDWMLISPMYTTSSALIDLVSEPPTISSIATFDDVMFRFHKAWSTTKYGQAPVQATQSNYTKILNNATEDTPRRFVSSKAIYPYAQINLFNESDPSEVNRCFNKLSADNFEYVSRYITAFNPEIIKESLLNRLYGNSQPEMVDCFMRLTSIIGIDNKQVLSTYMSKIREQRESKLIPNDNTIMSLPAILYHSVQQEEFLPLIEEYLAMFEGQDTPCAFILKGFSNFISLHPSESSVVAPFIIERAQLIASRAKFGAAKFTAVDVVEKFKSFHYS